MVVAGQAGLGGIGGGLSSKHTFVMFADALLLLFEMADRARRESSRAASPLPAKPARRCLQDVRTLRTLYEIVISDHG